MLSVKMRKDRLREILLRRDDNESLAPLRDPVS